MEKKYKCSSLTSMSSGSSWSWRWIEMKKKFSFKRKNLKLASQIKYLGKRTSFLLGLTPSNSKGVLKIAELLKGEVLGEFLEEML